MEEPRRQLNGLPTASNKFVLEVIAAAHRRVARVSVAAMAEQSQGVNRSVPKVLPGYRFNLHRLKKI